MIYLKYDEVVAKARAAFEEGRLQAQKPEEIGQGCRYDGPCAIGVSLDEKSQREFSKHNFPIDYYVGDDLETNNLYGLEMLQEHHDGATTFWEEDRDFGSQAFVSAVHFVALLYPRHQRSWFWKKLRETS